MWRRLARAAERSRSPGLLVDVDVLKRSQQMLAGEARVLASGGILAFTFAAEPPHALVALPGHGPSATRRARAIVGQPAPGTGTDVLSDLVAAEDRSLALACIEQAVRQPGVAAHAELHVAGEGGRGAWARLRVLAPDADGEGLLHGCLIPLEDQKRAEALAAERLAQLDRVVLKTGDTQRFLEGLQHMTELLQLSENEAGGYEVVSQAGSHLFPRWQGAVTVAGERGEMTVAAQWGRDERLGSLLAQGGAQDGCWAVRRGRLHHVSSEPWARDGAPACAHFGHGASLPPGLSHSICVPFSMPPDRRAALHLVAEEPVEEDDLYATFWRAETLVEAIELSLANLHLRVTLREQAERDGMTGLFNRRYFDDVLPREISRARRGDTTLTLALLDIDRFKSFNDAFGHEAGDRVIKAVAEQLFGFVRSYDVACRIGGEELAVLMSRAPLHDACARLDRLRAQIATRTLRHHELELPPITISIGVASLENGGADDLLRRADLALYASKDAGRNRVTCWTEELEAAASVGAEPAFFGSLELHRLAE